MKTKDLTFFSHFIFRNHDIQRNTSSERTEQSSGSDKPEGRGNWASKREYILSMIGCAVGLGNVWRFPYLAYKNGGGAFLIPYFIMLMVAGLPLFFMECSVGQFCSQGPINMWMAVPILQGVGVSMVLVSSFVSIYYNVILAYSVYYMFASFQSPLPWSTCLSWADEKCSSAPKDLCNVTSDNGSYALVNVTWVADHNLTCAETDVISVPVQSPSEQYWEKVALRFSGNLDETGEVVWHLALCLLFSWLIVGAALFKGIKSSGKVVYFTTTFPYLVLFILLVRGLTLEGSREGIEFYIGTQSNLTKLTEAEVWKDAATQIFFSLSVAWGGLTTLSSYNKFNNNCYKDSLIVCFTNCGTSVFAGFSIFSVLGHMAHIYDKPVSEVVRSDFALAFVAYPEALSKLPVSPLWSILFFFMLLTLGLDSQFAGIECITTSILDCLPKTFVSKKIYITMAACVIFFLLGLPCVTTAGIYWVNLIDHFCGGWILLVTALLELIGLCYVYGGNRFIKDIEMMIGIKSFLFWLWWRACWFFITPSVLIVILVWSLVTFSPPTYGSVPYPTWSISLGWCMSAFCFMWVPIVAVWKIAKAEGSLWQRCRAVCTATDRWGPYLECHREGRYSQWSCRPASSGIELSTTSNVCSINCIPTDTLTP